MRKYDIISFHPGKQHNLEQAQQLSNFFKNFKHITSLYFEKKKVQKWKQISNRIGSILDKRSANISKDIVDVYALPEIKLSIRKSFGEKLWYKDYLDRNKSFQGWIFRNYSPPNICIGFDTCSWELFKRWKNKSFLILDLSIAIPQYKLALAKKNGFSEELVQKLVNDDSAVYDVYSKEIELADMILCGSEFVKQSCLSEGVEASKLMVLPYGTDLKKFANDNIQPEDPKLKVVFIGSVTSRKGADIVLNTWGKIIKSFPLAELHFYGSIEMEIVDPPKNVFFHGFVAQETLIDDLKQAHISILPSFFEGSSLAIYQSMAMGLAIITTTNSGSIIENNKNGLIVEYGSEDELATMLCMLLTDRNMRMRLAKRATEDIREFTWDNYGKKLAATIENILRAHHPMIRKNNYD